MITKQRTVTSLRAYMQYWSQRSFQAIPVIDIAALVNDDDSAAKATVARQLDEACRTAGFFYILNHGISQHITEGVLREARNWFSLPAATKQEIALSSRSKYRGYQFLGSNVTRYGDSFQRDWHEAIDLYREGRVLPDEDSPVHGNNPWPHHLPEFDAVLRQYISSCLRVGQTVMRGIALGLGMPELYFEQAEAGATTAETSYWVTRVIHYPPLANGSAHNADLAGAAAQGAGIDRSVQLSCGEHTDYGLLTLVNQEGSISALQVKNQEGQWIDAKPIAGSLVCNLGDMLTVYSNGKYQPTPHRVINADPSSSRVSCPFFYEPAFEAIVQPIQQLVGAGRPAFRPVKYGRHLESKVLSNFELEEDQEAAAG